MEGLFGSILGHAGIIGGVIVAVLIIILLAMGYVKAPPDLAIIISGFRKKPRILIGRAGIRVPFLERVDKLLLKQITIDIKTDDYIPTKDFINIKVDAVAKVRVGITPDMIESAMKNFLNKGVKDIVEDLQDSLQGNMREIIGNMLLKEICNDRNGFGNAVQESATPDMKKLGIEILSCNIQNISDKNGLIEDMGMDNTSKIKKDAAIAKAESERDVAIAEANAKQAANEAEVAANTAIAEKNNKLAIKQAELKIEADIKQAEADAAYKIQEQEQRRTIDVASVNADIAKQERQAELKRVEVQVTEQALDAEIKKQAEAQKYAAQQKAEAEKYAAQQKAEAEKYIAQQKAEAKKYETIQEAEALKEKAEADRIAAEKQAAGIKAVGEAEAEAIRAKALAEAEGIDKKAEAMKKMGEASVMEMFFNAYPQIMAAAAKPLENVDSITMYGEGNSAKLVSDIVNSSTQVLKGMEEVTGLNLQAVLAGFLGGKIADNVVDNTSQSEDSYEDCYKEIDE